MALCCCSSAEWWNALLRGLARFQRLARDYERLPATVAGLHLVAFVCLMLHQFIHFSLSP